MADGDDDFDLDAVGDLLNEVAQPQPQALEEDFDAVGNLLDEVH